MRQGGGLTAWVGDWYDAFSSHGPPRDEIAMPKWANTNDSYRVSPARARPGPVHENHPYHPHVFNAIKAAIEIA